MSAAPPTRDPDTAPIRKVEGGERRRAAIGLGILAGAALVVVVVMLLVARSSGHHGSDGAAHVPGPAVTFTGSGGPTSSARTSAKATSSPVAGSPTSSHAAKVSCPSSAPCALPDDVGGALAAVNRYRAAHGRPAVTGSVTHAATACALSSGDDCPAGFYWEPVGRSGKQVVDKIAASGKGSGWLLDPGFTRLQIGWAYVPSSHGFECALISNG